MQLTRFGHTGVPLSRLCLDTATFGKQTDEAESHRILDAGADRGINFLDTADFCPMGAAHTRLGCTEEITGRWLKGKRHRFIAASKAGAPMSPLPWDQGDSRKHLLDAIDASLRRFSAEVGKFGQIYQSRYWRKREFETIEELRQIAAEVGLSLAKMSIAWVLANPIITSAVGGCDFGLLGASRPDQLTDTLAATAIIPRPSP